MNFRQIFAKRYTAFWILGIFSLNGSFCFAADAPTTAEASIQKMQKEGRSILIDFSATWCPTCRVQSKVLTRLKEQNALSGAEWVKIDYDTEKPLKEKLGVRSQSTFVAFQGLVETGRASNITNEGEIRKFLENSFAPITLEKKLNAMTEASKSKLSPEKATIMESAIEKLRQEKITEKAVKVGQSAPLFDLKAVNGKVVRLKDELRKGPVILTFYRGGWCPYCNEQLRSYQALLGQFESAGAQLIAVSPDRPSEGLTSEEKLGLKFKVLSDPGNRIAKKYGLVFSINSDLKKIYRDFGIDLEKSQGNSEWKLPVPATYVIDRGGKVIYSFVDPDYRQRAEPSDILKSLKGAHHE